MENFLTDLFALLPLPVIFPVPEFPRLQLLKSIWNLQGKIQQTLKTQQVFGTLIYIKRRERVRRHEVEHGRILNFFGQFCVSICSQSIPLSDGFFLPLGQNHCCSLKYKLRTYLVGLKPVRITTSNEKLVNVIYSLE